MKLLALALVASSAGCTFELALRGAATDGALSDTANAVDLGTDASTSPPDVPIEADGSTETDAVDAGSGEADIGSDVVVPPDIAFPPDVILPEAAAPDAPDAEKPVPDVAPGPKDAVPG